MGGRGQNRHAYARPLPRAKPRPLQASETRAAFTPACAARVMFYGPHRRGRAQIAERLSTGHARRQLPRRGHAAAQGARHRLELQCGSLGPRTTLRHGDRFFSDCHFVVPASAPRHSLRRLGGLLALRAAAEGDDLGAVAGLGLVDNFGHMGAPFDCEPVHGQIAVGYEI